MTNRYRYDDNGEVTRPDGSPDSLGHLWDHDAFAMLGKVAATTARTEKQVKELGDDVLHIHRQLRQNTFKGTATTGGIIVIVQVLVEALQSMGVLK